MSTFIDIFRIFALFHSESNCVDVANFIIPISLKPDGQNFKYFKHIMWANIIYSLKYLRSMTLGCKDIEIKKPEFVTKTKFLYGE